MANRGIRDELKKIREDAERANNRIDNMYTVMLGFLKNNMKGWPMIYVESEEDKMVREMNKSRRKGVETDRRFVWAIVLLVAMIVKLMNF